MKAIVREEYGDPKTYKVVEIERPQAKSNEILIEVKCCTINRTDCGVSRGEPKVIRLFTGLRKPNKPILGTDFAGKVIEIGEDVKKFKVGDRVFGFNDHGISSYAEYMTLAESGNIAIIPNECSYKEAVASLEGAHYAINFINKVELSNDSKVLVYGATGAIGSAAIQLLKNKGCWVTAVCGTEDLDQIKAYGIDKVVDYKTEDYTKDEIIYDFVFDAVGKSRFVLATRILKEGGTYISSELGEGNENLRLVFTTLFFSKHKLKIPIPTNIKKSIAQMKELLMQKKFKPMIDRSYRMEDFKEGYKFVESGQKKGNVILQIGSLTD